MDALILDVESTGLLSPEPVEVCWLRLSMGRELMREEEWFCRRYKPSKRIELGALATHHILDEELVGCEPSESFKLPDGIGYLIGHAIDFDWECIGKPAVKRIDTCAMSRALWPEADSHSLAAMLFLHFRERAKELLEDAHSAQGDVENCFLILQRILNLTGQFATWEEMWKFSEAARIPEKINFGKHKGMKIKDLPLDYRQWILREAKKSVPVGERPWDEYLLEGVRRSMK